MDQSKFLSPLSDMKALSVSLIKNPNRRELVVQRAVRYGWQPQALISEAGLISLDVRETFLMQSDTWEIGMETVILKKKYQNKLEESFSSYKNQCFWKNDGTVPLTETVLWWGRAISPNQGVFQLKEIPIYLSLACLPHYLFDSL